MNVASLYLCKELYELSRWGLEHKSEFEGKYWVGTEETGYKLDFLRGIPAYSNTYPAYDLGYLLRKLPAFRLEKTDKGYHTDYFSGTEVFVGATEAETPEDATVKLAIELFKQGVLK
jgi:hypothetical protein